MKQTKSADRRAFTIVELVIVIAVIAILAAVLIPTFAGIIGKANDSAALMDANNLAGQVVSDIVERINEAGDLIIVQQKDDKYYVHAYLVDSGSTIAYRENPIVEEELEKYFDDNNSDFCYYYGISEFGTDFADTVEIAIRYLYEQGVIIPAMYTGDGEWWDPDEMKALAEGLEIDVDTARFRSDYKVIAGAFEKPSASASGHTCSRDSLTKHEGQTQTCVKNGWDAYYVCSCGKLYSDETPSDESLLECIEVDEALGHTPGGGCFKLDDTYHCNVCTVCNSVFGQEEHTMSYFEGNGYYEQRCACGYGSGGKIDLDDDTTTLPATFKLAMQLNLLLQKDAGKTQTATETTYRIDNGKHPTMYDAFCAVRDNSESKYENISDYTEANGTVTYDANSIVKAINDAEKTDASIGYTIVWDQNIDRFVVIKKYGEYGKQQVVFVPNADQNYWAYDDGDFIVNQSGLFNFWDTFCKLLPNSIDALDTSFSLYIEGQGKFDFQFSGEKGKKWGQISQGFDIGEAKVSQSHLLNIGKDTFNNYKVLLIVRSNGNLTINTSDNSYFDTDSTIKFYGVLKALNLNTMKEYENYPASVTCDVFGTIKSITVNENIKSKVTFIAESGSSFGEDENTVKSKFDNGKFTNNGGTFGVSSTGESN